MTLLIVLGIVTILVLWVINIYNNLIAQRNQVKNAWSQIDVQLQRRYDLIPNLVETVKGYMEFEKSTLQSVIEARNLAMSALSRIDQQGGPAAGTSMKELLNAEATLGGGLGKIFAVAESYPELRSNSTMQNLQEELSSTENKVSYARQGYNDQVMIYNTMQQKLPAALFARSFGHQTVDAYEIESSEAKKAVKVSF